MGMVVIPIISITMGSDMTHFVKGGGSAEQKHP
jgi:hypothetical protein